MASVLDSMPSQPQLALAMAIVKQKPPGMDIKEYVLQIRQYIKNAKEHDRIYLQDRFFDSVSFWQQAYERSEAEQSRLMDRVYELEQRNEALLAKIHAQGPANQDDTQGSTKRKANGNLGARKRAKTQGNLQPQASDMTIGKYTLVELPEYMEESTGTFMRHFYTLQRVIQRRPNRSSIVQASVELCQVAAKELLSAFCQKREAASRPKKKLILQTGQPTLTQVLRSIECTFYLVLQALQKLPESENTVQDKGQLVYYLIDLYQAVVKALEQYCITKSGQTPSSTAPKHPKSKQTRKSKGAKNTQHLEAPISNHMDEVATQVSQLLGSVVLSLDLSSADHRGLFEGLLFTLLTRVGTLLCTFVFQDLQLRPDLHVDSAKLPLPEGLIGVKLDETSLRAAQMESKHLLWPLERALALLDASASSSPTTASQDAHETMIFVTKTKEKLQGTLLQAVFGSNRSIFPHILQQPGRLDAQALESLRACAQVPEQTVPDWFTQEIWRLLGWELLANHGPKDC